MSDKIGIIVAMDKELRLLLPLLQEAGSEVIGGREYHVGVLGNHEVVVCKCGIGKVNAALGTDAMIRHFAPTLVINSGVAGGTGSDVGILDVVIASEIAYHDVWCGPGTVEGQAANCPARFAPQGVDVKALASKVGAKTGLVASGDIFVARRQDIERILALYPEAVAVDMESAAIAHACHLRGVPMICLRVVSDTPGGADNIAQYEYFWEDAPQRTFEALISTLNHLN